MRKKLKNSQHSMQQAIWTTLVLVVVLLMSCSGDKHTEHNDTYICPMHPTVISDRPSTCPVCGMDLVRKARPGEEVVITEDLAKLLKSPNETVVASIKTVKGIFKSVPVSMDAQGTVTYDTRGMYSISSRVSGRIENIFLTYSFQPVTKGQKVAEIYSPELVTAQRELIFLLQNDAENKMQIDAAKTKLQLLGLSSNQINALTEKREVQNTFSLFSDYSGYLITDQNAPTSSAALNNSNTSTSSGMSGMGGTTPSTNSSLPTSTMPASSTNLLTKQGDYVASGQTLFRIVNPQALRIELDIPSQKAMPLRQGDKLSIDFGEGRSETATVDFVQPYFNEGEDFLKLRIYTSNSKNLHIGHLIRARISLPSQESIWVPKEAVLDMGTDKVVFIKERGVLKPKKIEPGMTSDGLVQILTGLSSSDEIAANAQYLVDSESFIKTIK